MNYQKEMPLTRELYGSDITKDDAMSYDMSILNVRNRNIACKLFDLLAEYKDGFYLNLNDMLDEFNDNHKMPNSSKYVATMDGRQGKHLCLYIKNDHGSYTSCYGATPENTPAQVKRDFKKLAGNIRKFYIDWAVNELKEKRL